MPIYIHTYTHTLFHVLGLYTERYYFLLYVLFFPPLSARRDEMLEYMRSSEVLIKRLMDVLVKGLNVKRIDEIREPMLLGSRRVNLNYYPMCPNPELTVGVGRHSDISTFTILL